MLGVGVMTSRPRPRRHIGLVLNIRLSHARGPVVLLGRTGLRRGSRPSSRDAAIGPGAVDDATCDVTDAVVVADDATCDATDAVVMAVGPPCVAAWTGPGAGCRAET